MIAMTLHHEGHISECVSEGVSEFVSEGKGGL